MLRVPVVIRKMLFTVLFCIQILIHSKNKDEISLITEEKKPRIIGKTRPKNQTDFIMAEYFIAGFDMFVSKNPKGGA